MAKLYFFLGLRGALLGLLASVSGITFATAAFLIGSYHGLMLALRSCDLRTLSYAYHRKWPDLLAHLHWRLLLTTAVGAAFTYYLLPQLLPLNYWKSLYLAPIYAGICGILTGGMAFTLSQHRGAGFIGLLLFLGGFLAGALPLTLTLHPLPTGWEWMGAHGLLASFAQMLPGIPEAASRKLLGGFEPIAYYEKHGFWPATVLFKAGVAIGIFVMVNAVLFFLRKLPEKTTSLMLGMMASVLFQLWPLRYMQSTSSAELSLVVICFLAGATFSGLLQFFQSRTLA